MHCGQWHTLLPMPLILNISPRYQCSIPDFLIPDPICQPCQSILTNLKHFLMANEHTRVQSHKHTCLIVLRRFFPYSTECIPSCPLAPNAKRRIFYAHHTAMLPLIMLLHVPKLGLMATTSVATDNPLSWRCVSCYFPHSWKIRWTVNTSSNTIQKQIQRKRPYQPSSVYRVATPRVLLGLQIHTT